MIVYIIYVGVGVKVMRKTDAKGLTLNLAKSVILKIFSND